MGTLSEPDDIDFFVGGVDPDPDANAKTAQRIEEYKRRPEYAIEAAEAKRILAELGIERGGKGMPNPDALLDHWKREVARLAEQEAQEQSLKKPESKA